VRSIRVLQKIIGDPYYEPTIVVHDNTESSCLRDLQVGPKSVLISNIAMRHKVGECAIVVLLEHGCFCSISVHQKIGISNIG